MFSLRPFNINAVASSMLRAEAARQKFLRVIDDVMVKALMKTKQISWTPYDEGILLRSISMGNARYIGARVAIASLYVSHIKYARRQEYEHPDKYRKRFYLYRAMLFAQKEIEKRLKSAYALIPGGATNIGEGELRSQTAGTQFGQYLGSVSF